MQMPFESGTYCKGGKVERGIHGEDFVAEEAIWLLRTHREIESGDVIIEDVHEEPLPLIILSASVIATTKRVVAVEFQSKSKVTSGCILNDIV